MKIKLTKKLALVREKLSELNEVQQSNFYGGRMQAATGGGYTAVCGSPSTPGRCSLQATECCSCGPGCMPG